MSTETDEYLAHYGIEVPETVIEHHGVKGMKWGVRRTDEQLAKRDARRGEIDAARSRVNARKSDIKSAKGDAKAAKKEAVLNELDATKIKNGKEFAAWFFGGQAALGAVQRRSTPGDSSTQSARANSIDAARAKQGELNQARTNARITVKDLKSAQRSDVRVGNKIRDGKELAEQLLLGDTIRRNRAYANA